MRQPPRPAQTLWMPAAEPPPRLASTRKMPAAGQSPRPAKPAAGRILQASAVRTLLSCWLPRAKSHKINPASAALAEAGFVRCTGSTRSLPPHSHAGVLTASRRKSPRGETISLASTPRRTQCAAKAPQESPSLAQTVIPPPPGGNHPESKRYPFDSTSRRTRRSAKAPQESPLLAQTVIPAASRRESPRIETISLASTRSAHGVPRKHPKNLLHSLKQ